MCCNERQVDSMLIWWLKSGYMCSSVNTCSLVPFSRHVGTICDYCDGKFVSEGKRQVKGVLYTCSPKSSIFGQVLKLYYGNIDAHIARLKCHYKTTGLNLKTLWKNANETFINKYVKDLEFTVIQNSSCTVAVKETKIQELSSQKKQQKAVYCMLFHVAWLK